MEYKFLKSQFIYLIPTTIFLILSFWWFSFSNSNIESTRFSRQVWGAIYQIVALYGAIIGFFISKKWGGYKSLLGKIILFFSIGLFFQVFGQTYSSYYVFKNNVESPNYPGLGDIGFFGSILSYIYAVILLFEISGTRVSLKELKNKIMVIVVPITIILSSYFFFLKDYSFDWSHPITIFLDFGYPFGQSLYVSIAILALFMSRGFLGGIMKMPILFLIFALVFQYFSDAFFLYQSNFGDWYVGNINDYLYLVSYFIMTMGLINLALVFEKIKSS